jgi:hypothetical protein
MTKFYNEIPGRITTAAIASNERFEFAFAIGAGRAGRT